MFDNEGSRSEFLKLLASFGEEPAFLARARAPETALQQLHAACQSARTELLRWPKFYLAALASQIDGDWPRLGKLLVAPDSVRLLSDLLASMPNAAPAQTPRFTSDHTALRRFLQSAERFNRKWQAHLDGLNLEPVNQPRREYNQFYAMELDCAFDRQITSADVPHLDMIDARYLHARYPLLRLPTLA
jgi:hypothetical protein